MLTSENTFRPSAVIFDMDGLMFDTENLTLPLWETAGEPFGYKITRDIALRLVGISSKRSGELLRELFGDDFPYETIRSEFRKLVVKEIDKKGVPKKPGLDYLLKRLSAANIPMAVATSSRYDTAADLLRRAGVYEKFTAIIGGDDIVNGKPAPDIFLLAAEKLGHPPSFCAGLEDSPAGLRALKAAGIRSVFIKDTIEPPQEVLAAVWRRCNDLSEAAELFNL